MKKLILLFTFILGFLFTYAQQIPRDKVIVEIATGTWCTYCPGAAMGADDLVDNGHDVGVIEYHNGDPFANTASNARNNYYNVSGYPTANFDGVLEVVGGSHTQSMYSSYLPKYNQRIAIPSSFRVQIFGSNDENDYSITLVLDKVAASSASNLKAHLALTESEIPYSWQGMSELNFVERMMVPDHNGTNINFGNEDQILLELEFTLPDDYIEEHCELVAFIQDNSTKEIHQGTKVDLNNLYTYVPPLEANFEAAETEVCAGSEVQFTDMSGGEPTGWAWSFPGGTPDTSNEQNPVVEYKVPGDYDVTLKISRGFKTNIIHKESYMNIMGDQVTFDPIEPLTIDAPALELTQGMPEGGTYEGPGVTDGWFYPDDAGMGQHELMYIYQGQECTDTAYQVAIVDGYTGMSFNSEPEFNIYPNPSQGVFYISVQKAGIENADMMVFSSIGKIIMEFEGISLSGNSIQKLDLSDQKAGVYYLRIRSENTDIYKKLVIKK